MRIHFVPDGATAGTILFCGGLGNFSYRWCDGAVRSGSSHVGAAVTRERAVRLAKLDLRRLLHRSHKALLETAEFTTSL